MEAVKFGRIMNLLVNAVLNIVLVSTALVYFGSFSFIGLATGWCSGMGVGYLIGDLIPGVALGGKLADKLNIHQPLLRHIVSTAVVTVLLIPVISLICNFSTFALDIFSVWPHLIGRFMGLGYIALLIVLPIAQKIAVKCSGFDPSNVKA